MPILAPYKMASSEVSKEPTVVRARGLIVGGGHVGVIAGPCSVENRDQMLRAARQAARGRRDRACAAAPSSRAPAPTRSRG